MSDVSVSLGVTGKDTVIGSFRAVSVSSKEMAEALMEHTKKLAEMFLGFEAVKKAAETCMKVFEEGGALNDLSDRTGIAVEKLVLLQRAFQNNGLEADDVGGMINRMQKAIAEGGEAGSQMADKLHRLGLEVSVLKSMNPESQFEEFGKAIMAIPDPAERSAAAMEIFGKSGGRMLALFAHMGEEIKGAGEEVGTYASIMGEKAGEFDKIGDKLQNSIGHKVVEFFAGALSNLSGGLAGLVDSVSKFDAAALGQKITSGLSEPMMAFAKAITTGQFKEALDLGYEMVKLQAMKMGNAIVVGFEAAYEAIKVLTGGLFGFDGPIITSIKLGFHGAGIFIANVFHEAFLEAGSKAYAWVNLAIAALTMNLPKVIAAFAELKNVHGQFSQETIQTGKSYEEVAKQAWSTASAVWNTSKGAFDTGSQLEKINSISEKISGYWQMTDQAAEDFLARLGNPSGFNDMMKSAEAPAIPWAAEKASWANKGVGPIDDGRSVAVPAATIFGGYSSTGPTGPNYGLLSNEDWRQVNNLYKSGSPISASTLTENLLGARAMQAAIQDMSYYSHKNDGGAGGTQESYADAVQSLATQLKNDAGVPGKISSDYKAEAERQLQEQMNKRKGGDPKTEQGKGSPSEKTKDPGTNALEEILKVVRDINNTKLPVMALS